LLLAQRKTPTTFSGFSGQTSPSDRISLSIAGTLNDQRELLFHSCQAVKEGKMPGGIYTRLRPEATLSPQDVKTICAASQTLEASANTASTKP
jgi:hypothetical protein